MEDKLRAYMDHLFREVKPTKKAVELKEEILQNLCDKYRDLVAEGKTPEAAYNIAVAGIGDPAELLSGLKEEVMTVNYSKEEIEKSRRKSAILVMVAVMLYITCVIPVLVEGGNSRDMSDVRHGGRGHGAVDLQQYDQAHLRQERGYPRGGLSGMAGPDQQ